MCLRRTFSYILRELPKVPTHVPVCVLGNYRDMGEHRVILPDDVRDLMDRLDRWVSLGRLQEALQESWGLELRGLVWDGVWTPWEEGGGLRTQRGSWLPGTRQVGEG